MSQTKTKFKSFSELGKHFGLPSVENKATEQVTTGPSVQK